jgi:hypothetical protein
MCLRHNRERITTHLSKERETNKNQPNKQTKHVENMTNPSPRNLSGARSIVSRGNKSMGLPGEQKRLDKTWRLSVEIKTKLG